MATKKLFYLTLLKFLVIFICIPYTGVSQIDTNPEENISTYDYAIKEFTLPGGRLFNNVNAITEDPYGFLWFGTHNGIVRYDGYEFIIYTKIESDSTSLSTPYVESIYWDSFDKLWVGTNNGGLFRFDPESEQFTHFKHISDDPYSISNSTVTSIAEDGNGDLWFGTINGLNLFNRKTEKFTQFYTDTTKSGSLTHDAVYQLYTDKKGTLWIGTGMVTFQPEPGGLECYSIESNTFTPYLYNSNDESLWTSAAGGILEDRSGNFWVGTTAGLQKMDRETGNFKKMNDSSKFSNSTSSREDDLSSVRVILEDQKGGLWFGGNGKKNSRNYLVRYDSISKRTYNVPIDSPVWELYESSDGTIWVASGGLGRVYKITPIAKILSLQTENVFLNAFKETYPQAHTNEFIGPYHLTADNPKGILWAGCFNTSNGQVFLGNYNPQNKQTKFFPLTELINKSDIKLNKDQYPAHGMGIDKEGKIWGTLETQEVGLFSFNPKTNELQHFKHQPKNPNSLSTNLVSSILLDSRGEIWVATYGKGLNRFNPKTNQFIHYTPNEEEEYQIGGSFPLTLIEDTKGIIWVGGGINKPDDRPFLTGIDPVKNKIKEVVFPKEVVNTSINHIALKKEGSLILSLSKKGYAFYGPESEFLSFHVKSNGGFVYDNIAAVVIDSNNVIWTASNDEANFTRQNYPDAVQLFKGKHPSPSILREAAIDTNGHIYFVNTDGLVDINPDLVTTPQINESDVLQLIDFYVLGEKQLPNTSEILSEPIWQMNQIELNHKAETFAFRFSDFNFHSNNSKFEYRLYPYESNWQATTGIPYASYNKVPAGKYEFQVRGLYETGNINNQNLNLHLTILPPWWKTWWAYTLYGIGALGILYSFRKHELKKQKQRLKIEKDKLAEQQRINAQIAKFVPNAFIQSLGKKDIMEIRLGDAVAQEVTVLFSDIRNYTTLAEQMTPQENFQFVNAFNRRMGPIIQQQQGFVNQYLGDAIMALFKESPEDALRAAIEMQHTLRNYNIERRAKDWESIRIGIGFHTGSLIMGIIGDDHRMDAATISDSVNIAARIESLTKYFGASILLSEDSFQQIPKKEDFNFRYLGQVIVKGKLQPIGIYECFDGDTKEQIAKKTETLPIFDAGLNHYFKQSFPDAILYFEKIVAANPLDAPTQLFLSKALHYSKLPTNSDWTGVEKMEWK